MKKSTLILLASILAVILLSSCSRKIIGATPHRRDRHCGCENICIPHTDTPYISQPDNYNID